MPIPKSPQLTPYSFATVKTYRTMVMIIHGFPNNIAALRFEWAWQHPYSSRRLRHVAKKKSREKTIDFCFRVLSEMLLVGPWNRLPLTIRWLNEKFIRDFPAGKAPPTHMPITSGAVITKKLPKDPQERKENTSKNCSICYKLLQMKPLKCLNPLCDLQSHIICFSRYFCNKWDYVPIEGACPKCHVTSLWGTVIRKYRGCDDNSDVVINVEGDFYSSDEEAVEV